MQNNTKEFVRISVEYHCPQLCSYPEYRGKPYFGIVYKENGQEICGFGTYKPEVLSRYLKDYFILPKTAHWIGNELGHCDNCEVEGCYSDIWNNCKGDKYCPNCGAKIIDEEENK